MIVFKNMLGIIGRKKMKQVKKIISTLVCVLMIFTIILNGPKNMSTMVYAEESTEETIEFETLEKQILNSERWCNASSDEINVALDIETMWFLPDDDIIVSYLVSNEEEITNFCYSATGFEIVDAWVNDEQRIYKTLE